jgi:hypothetical protein
MNDRNFNPDDEADAADRRIEDIVGGGRSAPARPEPAADFGDDFETDSVARARSRATSTRSRLGASDEPSRAQGRSTSMSAGGGTGAARNQKALLFIGGLVGAGILVVLIIVFAAQMFGGSGSGGLFGGPTATATATETPVATETPIPTSTRVAPNLALPPLTCIFQSGTGCSDYCAQPANASECSSAKDFIRAQSADPDEFFRCVSPGPGPNQGDPQACLRQAWYKANP